MSAVPTQLRSQIALLYYYVKYQVHYRSSLFGKDHPYNKLDIHALAQSAIIGTLYPIIADIVNVFILMNSSNFMKIFRHQPNERNV